VGAVSVVAWSKNEDVSITLIVFSVVIAGLLIWSHRSNIERLKSGTESKIYLFGKQAENNNKQEKKE
jgi:glycerol-3-phosphate acyltransferase PlsY